MRIFVYGNDGRLAVCRQLLLSAHKRGDLPLGVRDLYLLPIPSYRFSTEDFADALSLHRQKAEGLAENAYEKKNKDEGSSTLGGAQGNEGSNAFGGVRETPGVNAYDGGKDNAEENALGGAQDNEGSNAFGGARETPGVNAYDGEKDNAEENALGGAQGNEGSNALGGASGNESFVACNRAGADQGAVAFDTERDAREPFDLIVGYGVQPSFFEFDGVRVLDLEADETFLRRNARLTALGAVGILLSSHTRALPELCVGVIGYGRIGRELVDILSFLGCTLVVFSANAKTKAELDEQGICTVSVFWGDKEPTNINDCLQNNGFFKKVDILLNTSPARFCERFFDGFDGVIYDLASGEPIPPSVSYTRLASLPMRMYSQSAGHAVYESVAMALYEIDRERIK